MFTFATELVSVGGPVVVILGIMSLISVAVIVVKIVQFLPLAGRQRRVDRALLAWRDGQYQDARAQLAEGRSPTERVLAYAMAGIDAKMPHALLDAELERRGNAEIAGLSRLLRLLEVIALVAPLLGLLGTVLGMIQSFQELEMAEGAANASVLAGGIWQALLTTAVGLVVAIPAAIAANLFAAAVERSAHLIETSVGRLNLLARSAGDAG